MGFRIGCTVATVPASVEDGLLHIYIDQNIPKIAIPIKTQKFSKQCNFIMNIGILLYLINEEYSLIIWEDGTGSLLTKKKEYLVMNFKINKELFPKYKRILQAGMYIDPKTQQPVTLQYLEGIDKRGIVFAEQKPLTIRLSDKGNEWYLKEIYKHPNCIYPILEFNTATNLLYIPYENGVLPVKGEYYITSLFSML